MSFTMIEYHLLKNGVFNKINISDFIKALYVAARIPWLRACRLYLIDANANLFHLQILRSIEQCSLDVNTVATAVCNVYFLQF